MLIGVVPKDELPARFTHFLSPSGGFRTQYPDRIGYAFGTLGRNTESGSRLGYWVVIGLDRADDRSCSHHVLKHLVLTDTEPIEGRALSAGVTDVKLPQNGGHLLLSDGWQECHIGFGIALLQTGPFSALANQDEVDAGVD